MTRVYKILTAIGAVFLCGAIASGTILAVKKTRNVNDEKEAIQLTVLDSAISTDADLGKLKPGVSKTQSFSVTSLIDMKVTVFLSFSTKEKDDAYEYVGVSIDSDKESNEGKLNEYISGKKDFHFHLAKKENKEIMITYTLADDIPESIIGKKLNFEIAFDANSAL